MDGGEFEFFEQVEKVGAVEFEVGGAHVPPHLLANGSQVALEVAEANIGEYEQVDFVELIEDIVEALNLVESLAYHAITHIEVFDLERRMVINRRHRLGQLLSNRKKCAEIDHARDDLLDMFHVEHDCTSARNGVALEPSYEARYKHTPRGSNSSIETDRVRSQEKYGSSRGPGKTDAGTKGYEKKGFGSEKGMQANPKKSKAPQF